MNNSKKILNILLIFVLSCFLGWICEELYCYFIKNVLVNRGFLYGPYLPVYGFGSVLIILLLKRYKDKPIYLFILSILVTGTLEYLTGYLLFIRYRRTWWNYNGLLLNINGYVCLRSVLMFSVLSFILIYIIDPFVDKIIKKYSNKVYIYIFSLIILFIMLCDFIMTIIFRY